MKATTALESAARERWDAIVIGAGPAGALAARRLAERRWKTLLVDRKAFPRDKVCGGCISRRAVSLLEQAGLGPVVHDPKGAPLHGLRIVMKSRSLEIPLPGGIAISRADFDEMLVRSAIAAGAEFLPLVQASVQPMGPSKITQRRIVNLTGPGGHPVPIEARAIVAADGLGHPSLRRLNEFADGIRPDSRIGLGVTLKEAPPGWDWPGVTMAVAKPGYVGAVRLREGAWHLAASVDRGALRSGHSPAGLISQILKEADLPIGPELAEADWQGTASLSRRPSFVAGSRVFLAGDAAGYVEPFTGEGIAWAIATGLAVPAFVEQSLQGARSAEREWEIAYRRLIRRRQDWCQVIAWLLRKPVLASAALWFMNLCPSLPRLLARKLNGPLPAAN